jgi:HEPN domain-containing protein
MVVAKPSPHYDTGVYHCQQCAEKAVKGFLLFHDVVFQKTHDVQKLVEEATLIDNEFLTLVSTGAIAESFCYSLSLSR